ncbi:histidine phosphatase family protein [Gordonia caeni]|uniref:Histidine phosphatase family protein n=1 Tax=Gordonia caeni TaxID=1007097 RepID=A0ABP7NN74_9ACTN
MDLYVVRHAQPHRISAGTGGADPALTELGRRQAAALAEWFAGDPDRLPTRIVSSPMLRARETAEPLSAISGIGIDVDPRLAEFDIGASEYVPIEAMPGDRIARVEKALLTGEWGSHRFDPHEFRERVLNAFTDIAAGADGRPAVVVCHGGVLNVFLCDLAGAEPGVFFEPVYTSISRVVRSPAGPLEIASLNLAPHAAPDLAL